MNGRAPAALLVLLALATSAGCVRGCACSRPPIHVVQDMDLQPKYRPQAESAFFADGATMRPPVPGTVARGQLRENDALYLGRDPAGAFVTASPLAATPQLLARGEERYGIYCAPCHDARGNGKGILFQRGNVPTPSFHDERLRGVPDGELFDVITNGKGLMPSYRFPVPPEDRWAIVAHVRQLQQQRATQAAASPGSAP